MLWQRFYHEFFSLFVVMLVSEGAAVASERTTIVANNPSPAVNEQIIGTVTLANASGSSCWEQGLGWDTGKLRINGRRTVTTPFGIAVTDSRSLSAIQTLA